MRFLKKGFELFQCTVSWIDAVIVGDIITIVSERGRVERKHPDSSNSQFLEIIQLFHQTLEIADTVTVTVAKGLDVKFVYDRVFVPEYPVFCRRMVGGHG